MVAGNNLWTLSTLSWLSVHVHLILIRQYSFYLGQGVLGQLHGCKDISFSRHIVDWPPRGRHLEVIKPLSENILETHKKDRSRFFLHHRDTCSCINSTSLWMTLKNSLQNPRTFCLVHCINVFHWANWTITHLDKHILVLHHKRIGVNVAWEWFALVDICAVLQLAGDIQRLCSHTHTQTHTYTRVKAWHQRWY